MAHLIRSALSKYGFLLAFVVGFLYMGNYYGRVISEPNAHQFSTTGDGVKGYYSLAYHVAHDSTWWHFEGMNHPFGDHLHYPDAQPVLANGLKALSCLFPAVKDQTVAWLNCYLILGFLLGFPFLFLLFRELGVELLLAFVLAFACWVLCPQAHRIGGHFGLAHSWVIPAALWCLLRGLREPHAARWYVYLFLTIGVGVWTHPYLAVIAIAPVVAYILLSLIVKRPFRRRSTLGLVIAASAPLLLFQWVNTWGPEHIGRNEFTLGFYEYLCSVGHLWGNLSNSQSPIHSALFGKVTFRSTEGACYLGGLLLALPLALILTLRSLNWRSVKLSAANSSLILFMAASLVLLFSFGLPFLLMDKSLIWEIPLLHEFRSAGRFSWPFYYVAYAMCAVLLGGVLVRSPRITWLLVFVLVLVNSYEAHFMHKHNQELIVRTNFFDRETPPDEFAIAINSLNTTPAIRAILPLPYYHYGSGAVWMGAYSHAQIDAMVLSFHSGLPLISSAIAKASVNEAQVLSSLYAPNGYPQPLADHFGTTDQIAILEVPPIQLYDSIFIKQASPLGSSEKHHMWVRTGPDLFQGEGAFKENRIQHLMKPERARSINSWYTGDTIYHFTFDEMGAPVSFLGNGAYDTENKEEINRFVQFEPGMLKRGKHYVASFWCNAARKTSDFTMFVIEQQPHGSTRGGWDFIVDGREARIRHNGWSYIEMPFECQTDDVLSIAGCRATYYPNSIIIDELLVRELGDTVVVNDTMGLLRVNGIPVKPPPQN